MHIKLMGSLLHAAVVAIGIFEPQTHFGSVFLEVKKLFGVEGSTSLPKKKAEDKNVSVTQLTLGEFLECVCLPADCFNSCILTASRD